MGAPVVVVDSGGLAVTVTELGVPMTVGANSMGIAVTIVDAGGFPVVLLNDDGSEYSTTPPTPSNGDTFYILGF